MNRLLLLLLPALAFAQDGLFPLESVTIQGSVVSRAAILDAAGLQLGMGIDKPHIDAACTRLQASGIFESINYNYAPAPKGGVALTLILADPHVLSNASIDVPGLNEAETWDWLKTQYPNFDRKIPGAQGAQEYLAKTIEQHLGNKLHGQHLVARMEQDFTTNRSLVSLQPETLPKVTALSFTGQQEIPADKLQTILMGYAQTQGYTDRGFRQLVELNLRAAYEDHGMYRVKFPSIAIAFVDGNDPGGDVSVAVSIEEGPKYTLGATTVSGDAPAPAELLQAAAFKSGELANWSEIQAGIYSSEKPLKQRGYLVAKIEPERAFDDQRHLLNLNLKVAPGPQFHFGDVHFQGLPPDMESKARGLWKMKAGDPFDPFYSSQFVADFSRKTDLRQFKKRSVKDVPGPGEHVRDVILRFE